MSGELDGQGTGSPLVNQLLVQHDFLHKLQSAVVYHPVETKVPPLD